jgi:hypothetical protein
MNVNTIGRRWPDFMREIQQVEPYQVINGENTKVLPPFADIVYRRIT